MAKNYAWTYEAVLNESRQVLKKKTGGEIDAKGTACPSLVRASLAVPRQFQLGVL